MAGYSCSSAWRTSQWQVFREHLELDVAVNPLSSSSLPAPDQPKPEAHARAAGHDWVIPSRTTSTLPQLQEGHVTLSLCILTKQSSLEGSACFQSGWNLTLSSHPPLVGDFQPQAHPSRAPSISRTSDGPTFSIPASIISTERKLALGWPQHLGSQPLQDDSIPPPPNQQTRPVSRARPAPG